MIFNPRVLAITDLKQAEEELKRLGCDKAGINIMSAKAVFKTIKLEQVPAKAANLLKQTFLAKGGEVAVARGTADLSIDTTDVVICGTLKQYRIALSQLKMQPWGLPEVARQIETVLNQYDEFPLRHYQWNKCSLAIAPGKTIVMGILNITPDSFSDGGKYNSTESALRRVEDMLKLGVDIIDVGAESTRPYGAVKISAEEEMHRLLPILEKIIAISSVPISVDTYKAKVAKAALEIGAHIINDIWGLTYDDDMASVIACYNSPVVIMHNKLSTDYQGDIMAEILSFLSNSIEIAKKAGISSNNIIVDPGIGFGKTPAQNLLVMSRLEELKSLGCPILLGTSRKRFIGEVLNTPAEARVEGTGATVAVGIYKGVNIIRVHDVDEMIKIAKMTDSVIRGGFDE